MIVEDSIPFRTLFKGELLSQFPSTQVIEAGRGEEALKRFGSHPVDLVFMDIGLPGQNGLEVTKRIKADHPDTTIAILTGYDLPEYRKLPSDVEPVVHWKRFLQMGEIFTLVKYSKKQNLMGG
jgi:CheY-like chemotaxis protein